MPAMRMSGAVGGNGHDEREGVLDIMHSGSRMVRGREMV